MDLRRWSRPGAIAVRMLPDSVEFINDDGQLTVELELTSACDRIGRSKGRIFVLQCAKPPVAR